MTLEKAPTFGDEKVTAAESPGSGAFLIMHSFCGHFAPSKPKLNPTNLEILDSPLIGKVLKTPKKNIQPSCDAYRLEVWWKNKTSWEKKLMIITCTSAPSRSRYPIFQLYICIYIYIWCHFFMIGLLFQLWFFSWKKSKCLNFVPWISSVFFSNKSRLFNVESHLCSHHHVIWSTVGQVGNMNEDITSGNEAGCCLVP